MNEESLAFFTVVWAVGLGVFAQLVAHRFRLPSLVLLLGFGVIFGPDILGLMHPDALRYGLPLLVKLAVAIVLFEGALSLRLAELKNSIYEVRRLITVGAGLTWIGASAAGVLVGGLELPVALLFGALVTVTGPTVVQPLLKRLPIGRQLKTILEGEAILIDPIGAILAVAIFEAIAGLSGHGGIEVLEAPLAYAGRLLAGIAVGGVGGIGLSWLLKQPRWVPLELKNLVALAGVLVVYGVADGLFSEAGIMAAVVMGLVVQREAIPEEHRLRRFKEQLTLLAISVLFVLLAADLPLSTVLAAGPRGILVTVFLILLVRPIAVFASLRASDHSTREKVFIAAMGPRGIVSASVASLFALALGDVGETLLAMVFITIFITVTLTSLLAPALVRWLGLHRGEAKHTVIVGAGGLGRTVARILVAHEQSVTLVDHNPHRIREAHREKLPALEGNALEEDVLEAAGADEARTILAITTNPEVNLLVTHIGREVFGIGRALTVLDEGTVGPELVYRAGGQPAFLGPVDVESWDHTLSHHKAVVLTWRVPKGFPSKAAASLGFPEEVLPLVRVRDGEASIVHASQSWNPGETVYFASVLPEEEALEILKDVAES